MTISVIFPTYNKANILEIILNSFLCLKYEKTNYEIIVVDNNNNTNNTEEIVKRFVNKLPVRYLYEKKQGKNNALNSIVKKSNGDILVFTDDDVLVNENWLDEIYSSTLRYTDCHVFGGKIFPQISDGTPEWIKNSEYSAFVFAIHNPAQSEGEYINSDTPGGPNCWVRKCVFQSGNMYTEDIAPKGYGRISSSELEFFTRLLRKGIIPVYIPTAIVTHRIQKYQTKKKYLIKRSYASGRGFIYIQSDNKSFRFFGIPNYIFRQTVEGMLKALFCYTKLDIKSAFEHVMTVAHRMRYIKQYRLNIVK
jgi:glucosyl-dolichyl phosphate glucuronosyltransferase